MYTRIKNAVQQYGEVMIKMASGQEAELHLHNTSFDEEAPIIKVDADDETHWLNTEQIERYWIHRDF